MKGTRSKVPPIGDGDAPGGVHSLHPRMKQYNRRARRMSKMAAVVPKRERIVIPGLSNMRDFGGYRTQQGDLIPAGRFFRSAHLGRLTPEAGKEFARFGLRTVIDLRGQTERLNNATAFDSVDAVNVVSAPVEPGSFTSMQAPDGTTITAEVNRERILWIYRRFGSEFALHFGAGLRAVFEAADAPLLIHCTAGKDRTGFLAALILTLLGAPRETVLADYLLTNHHWDREYSGRAIFPPEVVEPLLLAHEAYLDIAFEAVERNFGSVERYAAAATGEADFAHKLRERVFAR